jgi:hypothetical protein
MLQNCVYLLRGEPGSCNKNEFINKEVGEVKYVEEENPMPKTFAKKVSLYVYC